MTTPNKITELRESEIFVFGSNLNGSHGGGAALQAEKEFGAEDGVGEGLTGKCYAFPTLNKEMQKLTVEELQEAKAKLYKCAGDNKDKQFLVTKVGCGIAGFTEDEMKEIFKGEKPSNIILPAGWSLIRGFKAFDKDLKCRDYQYEFGKDFYHKGELELCGSGFHFCKNLSEVYNYYTFGTEIIVCEIESEGDVIDEFEGNKSVTNHLRIVRRLGTEEAMNNNGSNNLGHSNTGDWNTGDRNTGHRNTGDRNTGHRNTGDRNTGDRNTGHRNTGHRNTGDRNTGDRNTGHRNTGDRNTGDRNTGDRNTGDRNTGDRNTGDRNTGDRNTGHRNTGDWNTGDWNTGHRNTGGFNTISPEDILVFNKPCKYEIWDEADKPSCLYFNIKQWIDYPDMTDKEKADNESAKTAGGYIKQIDYKEAFTNSMKNASEYEIELIKKLPNFDADVFEEISGFRIK